MTRRRAATAQKSDNGRHASRQAAGDDYACKRAGHARFTKVRQNTRTLAKTRDPEKSSRLKPHIKWHIMRSPFNCCRNCSTLFQLLWLRTQAQFHGGTGLQGSDCCRPSDWETTTTTPVSGRRPAEGTNPTKSINSPQTPRSQRGPCQNMDTPLNVSWLNLETETRVGY